jgi:hypothetical protein
MPALTLSEQVIRGATLDPVEHFKEQVTPTEKAFSQFAALFQDQVASDNV